MSLSIFIDKVKRRTCSATASSRCLLLPCMSEVYVHETFCSISTEVIELALAQGAADKVDPWHRSGLLRRPFYVQQWMHGRFESVVRADALIKAQHRVQ